MAIWPAHTSQAVTICMAGSVLTLCLHLYPFYTAQPGHYLSSHELLCAVSNKPISAALKETL